MPQGDRKGPTTPLDRPRPYKERATTVVVIVRAGAVEWGGGTLAVALVLVFD
jgi:hypothetical protein